MADNVIPGRFILYQVKWRYPQRTDIARLAIYVNLDSSPLGTGVAAKYGRSKA